MSLETLVSADREAGGRLSARSLAYLAERARNSCYDYVMRRFQRSGITKADLARRVGKDPAQINRMLASSGNWTIGTMAELLAAISEEEFLPSSLPLKGRPARNFTQADLLAQLAEGVGHHGEGWIDADSKPSPTASSAPSVNLMNIKRTREYEDV